MKHELTHAFAAIIVTGTGNVLDRISDGWKALGALVAAGVLGSAITTVAIEQRGLPSRVSAIEADVTADSAYFEGRLDALDLRSTSAANDIEQIRLLQFRILCRLDGGSANDCDIRYGGTQ